MKIFSKSFRLLHISYILLKHGLDEIVLAMHLFRPLRFLLFFSPARWTGRHQKPRGVRIREALEELGPIFVKFGQTLSTRFDILPEDIVKELVLLQDQVPPFPGETAKNIIEQALGNPLAGIFRDFDMTPLASASIAQVHAATLLNGKSVVVKVLRPNAYKMIQSDLELIRTISGLAQKYWKAARRFKPKEIVAEFEKAILNELDLTREAANASQLRRNFANSSLLYIPEIHWPLTKNNILVMERIYGIPISHIALLKQQGFNLKQLAKQGIEIFFTQVFRDCFFHADLHPGNIRVDSNNPQKPTYIAIDFGIMGSLSPADQRYLAENFLAFFKRDYRRVAELHIESGWVPPNTRLDEFEAAIRAVCEPILERPLREISFGQLLFSLFQMAARYQVNIQPQLILLQKTLVNIEGISRQLCPDLDLWGSAKPFLETWMKNQMGVSALIRKIKTYGPYWIEKLPELPELIYSALSQHAQPFSHPYSSTAHPSGFPLSSTKLGLHATVKQSHTSIKDIFMGILIGISLSLIWIVARSN
jgi:ubiquinone biosynthesis protein